MNKSGAVSFSGIKFILNTLAVVIIVVSISSIIRTSTSSSLYSGNQHYLNYLENIMFSDNGIMPDRITFNYDFAKNKLSSIEKDNLGIKLVLHVGSETKELFFDEAFFQKAYPLRGFDSYIYGAEENKPVIVFDETGKHLGFLSIEYIFKSEEVSS